MKDQTRGHLLPPAQPDTIEIFLPLKLSRFGGRKYLVAPDGATVPTAATHKPTTTMQRALGRAFYWRQEIESGKYETLAAFARQNNHDDAYVLRQVYLTFLAPSIVERILNNTLPRYITLAKLYPLCGIDLWEEQEITLCKQEAVCK